MNKIINCWNRHSHYYKIAAETNPYQNKKALNILINYAKQSNKILDLGCGEGSILNMLQGNKKELIGLDVSSLAIKLARSKHENCKFIKYNGRNIPFKDNYFDLVYSTYVLEHLANPEEYIQEAIRVTRNNGFILFIFPNYGSLVFKSPCFKGSLIKRSIRVFVKYLRNINKRTLSRLYWDRTRPMLDIEYKPDYDTLCEPDLITLIKFLRNHNCSIEIAKTFWKIENFSKKAIINFLGQLFVLFFWLIKIPPLKYWGLTALIVAKKNKP